MQLNFFNPREGRLRVDAAGKINEVDFLGFFFFFFLLLNSSRVSYLIIYNKNKNICSNLIRIVVSICRFVLYKLWLGLFS